MTKHRVNLFALLIEETLIDILIFMMSIEARAGLRGEVAVAVGGAVIHRGERLNERFECDTLRSRASVGRIAALVESADIANTDRRFIVTDAMRADHIKGSANLDETIKTNNEVVTDTLPPLLTMPAVYISCVEVLPRARSRAMYNDFSYLS